MFIQINTFAYKVFIMINISRQKVFTNDNNKSINK